jgi:hypothetical protein
LQTLRHLQSTENTWDKAQPHALPLGEKGKLGKSGDFDKIRRY